MIRPGRPTLLQVCLAVASLLFPSALFAQATPARARITQPIDESNRVTLKGNTHPLARPEFDRGVAPDNQPMNRALLLLQRSPDQEAALRQLLDDQQSSSSPNFHQWLTPAQFGKQFGPSDADIATITAWLQSKGFSVNRISAGRTVIEISGTAGQIRNAFHTEIHQYVVNGESHWANNSDPQIPAALALVVAGFASLNNFPVKSYIHTLGTFQKSAATGEVSPLFTFPGCNSGTCYAVGPADFATIYNTAPLLNGSPKIDGTGQTIAVVGESDINVQDIVDFRAMFGLPQNFSSANIILDGPDPGTNGSEGESALDVEWTGGVAPGATIDFVTSESTETTAGIFLSDVYIVDNNLAPIMSESFGGCEVEIGALNQFHNSLWEQAAAQGITVLLSAGDGGSAGCDNFSSEHTATLGLAVSGFASTPFDVAVGGTDFDDAGIQSTYWNTASTPTTTLPIPSSALSYIPEVPWNDSCAQGGLTGCTSGNLLNIVAGSGGVSTLYPKPSWQSATGVPSDGQRDLPDVSLFASNGFNSSFYIMCQSDATSPPTPCNLTNFGFTFRGVGGTSVSVQAFAGVMALVDQKYGRQGNANYVLYGLARNQQATPDLSCSSSTAPSSACTFYDITKGNNSVPCTGGSPNCSSAISNTDGVLVEAGSPATPAYPATAGYDLATGLGTVNVQNLVTNWPSVTLIGSSTALTFNNNLTSPITHGASVPVAFSVSPSTGSGTPTGDVSLIGTFSGGNTLGFGEFTLGSNGSVTGSTTSLAGGTYTLTAHYAGDGNFAPSNSTGVNVTVMSETSKVLITIPTFSPSTGLETGNSPSTLVYASPYIARIDVGNAQAKLTYPPQVVCAPPACPTGTITWTDSVNGAAPAPLDGGSLALNPEGYAEDQPIQLGGGSHVLTANYSGDSSFNPSSGTYSLVVTPAPTTTGPGNPPLPSQIVTPVGLGATVRSQNFGGAMESCNVTFLDGNTPVPGTVQCGGQNGGATYGAFIQPFLIVNQTTAGTHTYTAKFNGDSNYAPSTSAPFTTQVFYGTTVTITASPTNIEYGTNIILTATVDSTVAQGGPAISNAVTFHYGYGPTPVAGTVSYTPFTDPSGNIALRATITVAPQSTGFFTATFAGDGNYATNGTVNPVNVTVIVPDFSISAGPAPQPITAGQTGTFTFTITPMTNMASNVTLSCASGLFIANTPCNFSSSPVSLSNGAPVTVTLALPVPPPSSNLTALAAPHRVRRLPFLPRDRPVWWGLSALALLTAAMLMLPGRLRSLRVAFSLALVGLLCFVIGCGGGGSSGSGGGGGGPVASTTTLTTTSTKLATNTSATLTANVMPASAASGTVCFLEDGAGICPTLVNGTAQEPVDNPGVTGFVGTHFFVAQFQPNGNAAASQSGQLSIVFTGSSTLQVCGVTGNNEHCLTPTITIQ